LVGRRRIELFAIAFDDLVVERAQRRKAAHGFGSFLE
jgi:hypothetical protein